jgi:hypothetical protein
LIPPHSAYEVSIAKGTGEVMKCEKLPMTRRHVEVVEVNLHAFLNSTAYV